MFHQRWHRTSVVAAALVSLGSAQAQTLQLEPSVIESAAPNPAAIRAYVESAREGLVQGPVDKIGVARRSITRPLAEPRASVGFLTAYSSEVEVVLQAMLDTDVPIRRFNALRLAGELATDSALSIVAPNLKAADATDRYAAVSAIGLTFKAVQTRNTMTSASVVSLVNAAGEVWATDSDAHVARGALEALRTAVEIDRLNGVKNAALVAIARGGVARAKAIESDPDQRRVTLEALLSGAIQLRTAALDDSTSAAVLRESSVFAAHVGGQAYRAFARAGNSLASLPGDELDVQRQLLKAADFVLIRAMDWQTPLSEPLEQDSQDDEAFKRAIVALADAMSDQSRDFDRAAMLGE